MSTTQGGPGNIVTSGLTLCLDAANYKSYISGSSTWIDLINSNIKGTLTNGPTFSNTNAGSIVFDGSNDYVDSISQSISIQENMPCSVEAIFKTTASSNSQIIGNWDTLVSPGWRLLISSGNIIFYLINAAGNSARIKATTLTYNDNAIYHVCATYLGNSSSAGITIYVNGNPVTTTSILDSSPGTLVNSKITLGASQLNTTNFANYLTGNIYQIKLYDRTLSSAEVLQNYNATKSRFGL